MCHFTTSNRKWVTPGVSIELVLRSSIPSGSRSLEATGRCSAGWLGRRGRWGLRRASLTPCRDQAQPRWESLGGGLRRRTDRDLPHRATASEWASRREPRARPHVTLLTCGRCLDSLPLRPFHQESTPRHRSRKREIRSSFSGSCSPPRLRAIPSSRPLKPRLWRTIL